MGEYAKILAEPDYGGYTLHPAAELFPLMTEEEFAALVEDIRERGLLEPIDILAGTNQILDGRNRAKACVLAGVMIDVNPIVLDMAYDGDPYGWVVSKNLHRRHLTREQRDAVIARLREQGKSVREIADITKTPKSTVADTVERLSETGRLTEPERITGKDKRSRPARVHPKRTSRAKRKADAAKKRPARQEPTEGIKVKDDQVVDAEVVEDEFDAAGFDELEEAIGELEQVWRDEVMTKGVHPLEERDGEYAGATPVVRHAITVLRKVLRPLGEALGCE